MGILENVRKIKIEVKKINYQLVQHTLADGPFAHNNRSQHYRTPNAFSCCWPVFFVFMAD
jgi:hypothetical protein